MTFAILVPKVELICLHVFSVYKSRTKSAILHCAVRFARTSLVD